MSAPAETILMEDVSPPDIQSSDAAPQPSGSSQETASLIGPANISSETEREVGSNTTPESSGSSQETTPPSDSPVAAVGPTRNLDPLALSLSQNQGSKSVGALVLLLRIALKKKISVFQALLSILGFTIAVSFGTSAWIQANLSNRQKALSNDVAEKALSISMWQSCMQFPDSPVPSHLVTSECLYYMMFETTISDKLNGLDYTELSVVPSTCKRYFRESFCKVNLEEAPGTCFRAAVDPKMDRLSSGTRPSYVPY